MPRDQTNIPVFRSAFRSADDEHDKNLGIRPVVFDILAPDHETSLLPESVKLVLHVNPNSMAMSYSKVIERIQTKGGYVEQHWGEGTRTISFDMATGGFKRLYSGLSNITGGGHDAGGTRRESIAYDKFLDLLALFHNNGAIYDTTGQIAFQGIIKVSFDGGDYFGWFDNFSVNEDSTNPYMFTLSAQFTVSNEILRLRSFGFKHPEPLSETGSIHHVSAGGDVKKVATLRATSAGRGVGIGRLVE
tara:strand:+ start:16406 stop:17143 length:738 start_codon:yes stop_codon:yes gene_type:complete